MPYTTKDLPENVKNVLPPDAQEVFAAAFDNAKKHYSDPDKRQDKTDTAEETAYKVAWAAVEKEYEKGKDGKWRPKDGKAKTMGGTETMQ